MFEGRLGQVRSLVNGERALAAVRELARHHRIQSTPGYEAAAGWLEGEARAAGLEVCVERVAADGRTRYLGCPLQEGWDCARAVAVLHGARGAEPLADFAVRPLSLVQRSAPARGRFELVAAEPGEPGSPPPRALAGRIVLTKLGAQRAHEIAVREGGAAGLLCDGRRLVPPVRTDEHDRDSLAYTSFWWGADDERGWGFVVSPARGAELRARLAAGERLEVEVEIESRRFVTETSLVTATIPGTVPGEVLVTAHLCHPRPGANDNASGVAAALEAGRALASLARDGGLAGPRRTIRFLWMPEFTGTYAWLAAGKDRAVRTVAALNLDMVGESQAECGSTLLLERAPHFAGSFADELVARIRHASQEWVAGFSGPGHYSMVRMAEVPYSGGSDHAVWSDPAIGVPCPMLIQWPDRYYHSDLDGPERCDPASLAHAARTAAAYATTLACAGADEALALLALVGRGARRRLLAALDAGAPAAAARAERLRGQLALASVSRLAPGENGSVAAALAAALPIAADELDGFFESEILPGLPAAGMAPATGDRRVPVRLQRSPLVPMRGLQDGMSRAPAGTAEALAGLEARLPSGGTAVDLAWFACDGRRTIGEIAAVLADEGCAAGETDVGRLFEITAALGASTWAEGGP